MRKHPYQQLLERKRTWTPVRPTAGKLKEGSDIVALNERSVSEIDVGFHPGTNYSPTGKTGQDHIRLCYGYNEPEDITEGISRLANFLHKEGVLDS